LKIVIFETKSHVALTLTSDDLESRECLIDLNKYHYLVCGCIEFDCGHTDVRMYGSTYVRTEGWTFLPGLLGHLSGDDLKIGEIFKLCEQTDRQTDILTAILRPLLGSK